MRVILFTLSVGLAMGVQAQESSQSRLEFAETGSKDVAWPRKPDNRLSSLSGKMKDFREIPNQEYAGAKEFRSDPLYEDRTISSLASVPMWSAKESALGEKEDSRFTRDSCIGNPEERHHFDPASSMQEGLEVREERQLVRQDAMGWASRTSRTGQATDGSLQMYEGRLRRVRQQVNREASSTDRDLGGGRREKYSPEEVQKLLQQQPGLPEIKEMVRPALPVRVESPALIRP